eukprot:360567_1
MMDPTTMDHKNDEIKVAINPFNSSTKNQATREDQPLLQNSSDVPPTTKLRTYGISPPSSRTKSNDMSLQRLRGSSSRKSTPSSPSIGDEHYDNAILEFLNMYFQIKQRGSTIGTELRGGTVGFLTLAYIVLLNPQVL